MCVDKSVKMAVPDATDIRQTNNEKSEPGLNTSVLDLFDQHAKRSPNSIAAEFQGQPITYGQLHNASVRVAMELLRRGFRPRDRVPLVTSMGLEMLASVLGILRLGASYCPIDFKAWSLERVEATLEAVGSRLVLATVETTISNYELVRVPGMLETNDPVADETAEKLKRIRSDMKHSDLIYIIFTSGTTGKPKGVMVSHSSAAHLVQQSFPGAMRGSPGERVLLFFSVAFDGCAGVIFSTICHGGTLTMAQPSDVITTASSCNTLILTPSMLASLDPTPDFNRVHSVYIGGEAPTEALVRLWTSPSRKVFNCYGPTECTTAVSTVEMVPGGPIVLGHMVSEVEIVLLDDNLEHEVEQGEICIRGPCLAVGYLNMEALTRQKFFYRDGIRHYRTGDLARRGKDGLYFLGRVDRVVKNRGFLINLESEVEPALRSFPGVHRATAFLLQKQLVAFVTPSETSIDLLRGYLTHRFDAFIIPDLLFAIDDFPLTPNGKVDTKALQSIARDRVDDQLRAFRNPEGDASPSLRIVLEALGTIFDRPARQIPSTASFRALGGNSLTAVKLQSQLRRANLSLPLSKIFELDTVAAIARDAVSMNYDFGSGNSADAKPSTIPLTPNQLELLRETQLDPSSNYVFYCLTRDIAHTSISTKSLRAAWEIIFDRHSIYRTGFDMENKAQTVHPTADIDWREFKVKDYQEMTAVSERERETLWVALRSQKSPSLILKPYFWTVEVPGETVQINWLCHHLHTDAWSFGIILEELEVIIDGNAATLPPAPRHEVLAQHLNREAQLQAPAIEDFWKRYAKPWAGLRPVQLAAPEVPSIQPWDRWESEVPLQNEALGNFARLHGVSTAILIYTAWALVLTEYTNSDTVGMRVSVSGRNVDHPAAERVVGSLNGRCPLIVETEKTATIEEIMRSLQSTFFRVNDYQWTYPELKTQVAREFGDQAYWFDSDVVVLLDMPVDTEHWGIFEVQKPTAPFWLGVIQRGDVLNIRLRYDGSRYAQDSVEGMGRRFINHLSDLVSLPLDRKVGDLGQATQD
ncbi:nonribosomal peptide synthetase 11 [Colletotrichum caudatum]|nr:nonribosomal peptide synthetase 11 [Colletotrichum caudatum]